MTTPNKSDLNADSIMEHDHQETIRQQDRERQQNRHAFDSTADDDYSTGHNTSGYSENSNQSRFTDENDYPDGNMERYENRNNEQHFGRESIANQSGRAYDRSEDYEREREDDLPFIHDQADKFYGQRTVVDAEGKESDQFSSDKGQRYFTGDMGYHTKHEIDDKINRSVNKKASERS
jgi:hypothetical protein